MNQIVKICVGILLLGAFLGGCKPSYQTCTALYGDYTKNDSTVHITYDTTVTLKSWDTTISIKDSIRWHDSIPCKDVINIPKTTQTTKSGLKGSVEVKNNKLIVECNIDSLKIEIQIRDSIIHIREQKILELQKTQFFKDTRNWWQKMPLGGKILLCVIPLFLILLLIYLIVSKIKQRK